VASYPKGARPADYIISQKFSMKNHSELVKAGPYRLRSAKGMMHLTCHMQKVRCILEIPSIGCDEREQENGTSSLLGENPENLLETAHLTLASLSSPRDE